MGMESTEGLFILGYSENMFVGDCFDYKAYVPTVGGTVLGLYIMVEKVSWALAFIHSFIHSLFSDF